MRKNNKITDLIIMRMSVFVFNYNNTQDTIYNNKHLQRSNLKSKIGNYPLKDTACQKSIGDNQTRYSQSNHKFA